jgi:hypothetical protein
VSRPAGNPTWLVVAAVIGAAAFAPAPAVEAERAAPAGIATLLQAMDDADCATSKSGDWNAYAKTLAPEYMAIEADGSRTDRAASIAGLKTMPADSKVTGCSTKVDKVTRAGDLFFLYGTYSETGTQGPKHTPYRSVERIRDTWKRANGSWLQVESLAYEQTIWMSGKIVAHYPARKRPS